MRSGHNRAVDWWSLGALMYDMLTGAVSLKIYLHKNNAVFLFYYYKSYKIWIMTLQCLSNSFLSLPNSSHRSLAKTVKRLSTRSWSANSASHPTSHKKPEISWNGYQLFFFFSPVDVFSGCFFIIITFDCWLYSCWRETPRRGWEREQETPRRCR